MMRFLTSLLLAMAALIQPIAAQQYAPVFDYDSVMSTYFDDTSGLISFDRFIIGFAPEPPFKGQVAVVNAQNTVVASFPFYEDYQLREGVFARVAVVGPADVTLTEPGLYNIVFLIDGKMATRLPVVLEQTSAGEDPFNPQKTYAFTGLWSKYAYLTMNTYKEEQFPQLNLWLGGRDLPEGKTQDGFRASLYRNGELVAHSRGTVGHFSAGHYKLTKIDLSHPHTEKQIPNALPFLLKDWMIDGAYVIKINRKSDDALLRSFDFVVEGAKIKPLPQTQLGYEPGIDYMMPKVVKRGASVFGLVDAIWMIDNP